MNAFPYELHLLGEHISDGILINQLLFRMYFVFCAFTEE